MAGFLLLTVFFTEPYGTFDVHRLDQALALSRTGTGYLEVQRLHGDDWLTVAHDWDPETTFRWQRTGGGLSPTSEVTIDWHLPADVLPDAYRIVYHGDAK